MLLQLPLLQLLLLLLSVKVELVLTSSNMSSCLSRAERYISLVYKCRAKRKPGWSRPAGVGGEVLVEANVSLSETAFATLYAHCTCKWPPKGGGTTGYKWGLLVCDSSAQRIFKASQKWELVHMNAKWISQYQWGIFNSKSVININFYLCYQLAPAIRFSYYQFQYSSFSFN